MEALCSLIYIHFITVIIMGLPLVFMETWVTAVTITMVTMVTTGLMMHMEISSMEITMVSHLDIMVGWSMTTVITTVDITVTVTITMVIEPDIVKKQQPDGSPSGCCF